MFRVILIEDEPPILRNLIEEIRKLAPDFKIIGAYENGEDALMELEFVKPHVIVTDIRMPMMDGITLIEEVRKKNPDIICAIISGYQDFEFARKALQLGVTEYISKPAESAAISSFFSRAKKELLSNQSLLENEILRKWLLPLEPRIVNFEELAREYYFYADYLLAYAWSPENAEASLSSLSNLTWNNGLLKDGERQFDIPIMGTNEYYTLFGLHGLTKERIELFEIYLRMQQIRNSITVLLIPIYGQLSSITQVLSKARKLAVVRNKIDHASIDIITPEEMVVDPSRLELPEEQMEYLVSFLEKQKKTAFLNQLKTILTAAATPSTTRVQWIKTLHYLTQSVRIKSGLTYISSKISEQDLEFVVWNAQSLHDFMQDVTNLFAQLFMETDETERINSIEHFLMQNFKKNLTLADLAGKFHLNLNYLSRIYKHAKGMSPLDYMITLRIEEAKLLIKNHPNLLFKEIAAEVGYTDIYHFTKIFKKWTGMTPTTYRQLNES